MKHQDLTREQAKKEAIDILKQVGIRNSEERYSQYPHEFSGGMRQRVMIAIALACRPTRFKIRAADLQDVSPLGYMRLDTESKIAQAARGDHRPPDGEGRFDDHGRQ